MPCSLSPAAIALRLVFPAACGALMVWGEIRCPARRPRLYGRDSGGTSLGRTVCDFAVDRLPLLIGADDLATATTELDAGPLCCSERIRGALADHAPLFLGDHCHDAHRGQNCSEGLPARGYNEVNEVGG